VGQAGHRELGLRQKKPGGHRVRTPKDEWGSTVRKDERPCGPQHIQAAGDVFYHHVAYFTRATTQACGPRGLAWSIFAELLLGCLPLELLAGLTRQAATDWDRYSRVLALSNLIMCYPERLVCSLQEIIFRTP